MTVQAHADALLGLLRADSVLKVQDGAVAKGTVPPYVVVYIALVTPDGQVVNSAPLTGASERVVMRAYCHSVGANGQAARAVAQRVRTALLDVVPTIAGRECWPIRHEDSQPPDRDETTGVLVMDQVDVYRLESVPA